ncbi:MAG TPA: SUMF1/EgtB/PvdO family nonheme iron enzyme [Chthonomonadaceae bacterium]|nr:SUMF1/EgtB/PvdO family nonheme iron enzyme [Chthonomonadaceae bacterium]
MPNAPKLFISYARKDEKWLDQLLEHLRSLELHGRITQWTNREITPGSMWRTEIAKELKHADIAVLLVTPAFLASQYIQESELPDLLKKRVLWIAVESSLYTHTPLADLQCVNQPSKPLGGYFGNARQKTWVEICEKILEIAHTFLAPNHEEVEMALTIPPRNARLGDKWKNPKDNATLIYIPEGDFLMGDDDMSDNPRRTVTLDGYWIYETPVTVAQYHKFCKEVHRSRPPAPDWEWNDNYPIVRVRWYYAKAYCDWAGMKLPTEAQWEKAARGTNGRKYPWGNEWDASACANSRRLDEGAASVRSYPVGASPYGVLDMAGNVWEWCADWYDEDYYKTAPQQNPTGPEQGMRRSLRGGSWIETDPHYFRCAFRNGYIPEGNGYFWGFRACISVPSI